MAEQEAIDGTISGALSLKVEAARIRPAPFRVSRDELGSMTQWGSGPYQAMPEASNIRKHAMFM